MSTDPVDTDPVDTRLTPAGLPRYDDLPAADQGGRSGWGLFGDDDDLGLVNLLTPQRLAAAAGLVRTGAVFPLDLPMGTFDPPLNPARGNPRHTVVAQPGGIGFDDVWDNVWPQAGSQWDSLAHIGAGRDVYYGGVTPEQVRSGARNTVDRWARHGIAGRAVVLDMPATYARLGRDYDPGDTVEFGPAELEAARELAGVDWHGGDIVLLHTGFTRWYTEQDTTTRKALPRGLRAPGLEHTEAVCRWLWDAGIAALGTDTFAVEAWPADTSAAAAPFGFIHQVLIGSFGMPLGELWWLADVAEHCRRTGSHEGLLTSAPLGLPGGISSPPNALFLA